MGATVRRAFCISGFAVSDLFVRLNQMGRQATLLAALAAQFCQQARKLGYLFLVHDNPMG
jgi:hypothetical protein